ncbi:N-6 DNA methylase [Aeromonas caviae]|uniref:N-6 DNA methylase n=1 Tax=Aeromonas caviae TaxID=648 RepID=UPI002AB47AD4|nr:N-6 DNA methylase [Aeromonas caviae]MDY7799334.1 N-6 DNA methylase [Aeromonas caviae]
MILILAVSIKIAANCSFFGFFNVKCGDIKQLVIKAQIMNPHSRLKKRELGAYYTPPELSKVLVDWAITSPTCNILEPSFGGCGFFDSCVNRLSELGCTEPVENLFGVDIDKNAFDILNKKFETKFSTENKFIHNDFIMVKSDDFSVEKFDVVIGNPPYVSMHNMKLEQRQSCEKILRESKFSVSTIGRNASLWAFFILHSLSFLREGGKVAWVLPSSLMHADYARKVIDVHKNHFSKIKIIKLAERFFRAEGAEEVSVILLADGFRENPSNDCDVLICSVDTLDELHSAIYSQETTKNIDINNYKLYILNQQIRETYSKLSSTKFSQPLYHYFDIKIGLVTGANKYFVVDEKTIDEYSIPQSALKPIIGRFNTLIGLKHTKYRQEKIQSDGHRAYLVNPTEEQMGISDSPIRKYLDNITQEEIEKNRTFEKRKNWFAPDYGIDSIIPDAFMSYMTHLGPRIVINQAKVNCTNSIHKIIFHDKSASLKLKLAVSVSLLSSYSQLSSEIEGRSYGSGVLKIEPTAGKRIRVLLSDEIIEPLCSLVPLIEKKLDDGDYDDISSLVDNIFIASNILTQEQCKALSDGVMFLRDERYKGAKKKNA